MRTALVLLAILAFGCASGPQTPEQKEREERIKKQEQEERYANSGRRGEYAYTSVRIVSDLSQVKDCRRGFQMTQQSTFPSRSGGAFGTEDPLLTSMQKQAFQNHYDTLLVVTGTGASTVADAYGCSDESKEYLRSRDASVPTPSSPPIPQPTP